MTTRRKFLAMLSGSVAAGALAPLLPKVVEPIMTVVAEHSGEWEWQVARFTVGKAPPIEAALGDIFFDTSKSLVFARVSNANVGSDWQPYVPQESPEYLSYPAVAMAS